MPFTWIGDPVPVVQSLSSAHQGWLLDESRFCLRFASHTKLGDIIPYWPSLLVFQMLPAKMLKSQSINFLKEPAPFAPLSGDAQTLASDWDEVVRRFVRRSEVRSCTGCLGTNALRECRVPGVLSQLGAKSMFIWKGLGSPRATQAPVNGRRSNHRRHWTVFTR